MLGESTLMNSGSCVNTMTNFELALAAIKTINSTYQLIYILDMPNYQKHRKNHLVNIYEILRICRCLNLESQKSGLQ